MAYRAYASYTYATLTPCCACVRRGGRRCRALAWRGVWWRAAARRRWYVAYRRARNGVARRQGVANIGVAYAVPRQRMNRRCCSQRSARARIFHGNIAYGITSRAWRGRATTIAPAPAICERMFRRSVPPLARVSSSHIIADRLAPAAAHARRLRAFLRALRACTVRFAPAWRILVHRRGVTP